MGVRATGPAERHLDVLAFGLDANGDLIQHRARNRLAIRRRGRRRVPQCAHILGQMPNGLHLRRVQPGELMRQLARVLGPSTCSAARAARISSVTNLSTVSVRPACQHPTASHALFRNSRGSRIAFHDASGPTEYEERGRYGRGSWRRWRLQTDAGSLAGMSAERRQHEVEGRAPFGPPVAHMLGRRY